jgi:(p)ppGpp synthase/HD superfamily hydrolase
MVRVGPTGDYDDRMHRRRAGQPKPTLEDALSVAVAAHRGQLYPTPEPEPYILHPLRVMLHVTSRSARIVALLHDVVEDSDLTLRDLEERGFDRSVVDAVDCLSRRPDEDYEPYISRVASNPVAREVKLSDLADNLENNRALPPTPENLARIARYERAQRVLSQRSN